MLRGAALALLVIPAACRTAPDPVPVSGSAVSTPPAVAAEPAASIPEQPAPGATPVDPRYARACDDYLLGYCEETDDGSAEALSGIDLPQEGRAMVLARCVEALESVDANDEDLETFEGCRGCVGNCIDLKDCLPDPKTPWRVPEGDCED